MMNLERKALAELVTAAAKAQNEDVDLDDGRTFNLQTNDAAGTTVQYVKVQEETVRGDFQRP